MERAGLVSRRDDPSHKRKANDNLTGASFALVPLLAGIDGWGLRPAPAPKELSVRAKILEDREPKPRSQFTQKLRHFHAEAPAPRAPRFSRPRQAYEAALTNRLV